MKSPAGADSPYVLAPIPRHLSEQYLTSSQTFAQALRHTNRRPQHMQALTGRSDFLRIFANTDPNSVDHNHLALQARDLWLTRPYQAAPAMARHRPPTHFANSAGVRFVKTGTDLRSSQLLAGAGGTTVASGDIPSTVGTPPCSVATGASGSSGPNDPVNHKNIRPTKRIPAAMPTKGPRCQCFCFSIFVWGADICFPLRPVLRICRQG
jgi:hypothetical protein